MNIAELELRLHEEGCSGFSLLGSSTGYDAYCLDFADGEWKVFYTERGSDSPPIFSSLSESNACEYFLEHMKKEQNWHCVGFFEDEAKATTLESQLRALAVDPIRNDIPSYNRVNDPRYRVFVAGKQIHTVRKHLGPLPLKG